MAAYACCLCCSEPVLSLLPCDKTPKAHYESSGWYPARDCCLSASSLVFASNNNLILPLQFFLPRDDINMSQLPVELIELVSSFLRQDIDGDYEVTKESNRQRSATLLNFSLACRAFQQLARRHLYHTFSCDNAGLVTPLRVLTCFMEQRKPALLIQDLHTEMVECYPRAQHQETDRWGNHPRPGVSLQLCKLLLSLDMSEMLKEDIYEGLLDGYDDAETAMLLCMCANLRTWRTHVGDKSPLRLTHEEYDDQEFCETLQNKVIREARAPGSRLLQQLCEVHVRFDAPQVEPADTYYWTFNNVQDILMLPLKDQRTTLSSYRIFQHTSPSVQSSDVHCSKEA